MVQKCDNVITDRQTDRQTDKNISSECSQSLKGILAVCVLMHHLYLCSGLFRETIIGGILQIAGYLSVACFFFLSGYGLYASYSIQGNTYIKSFPRRKILPFYCIILFFSMIYFVERLILGQNFTVGELIKSITFGGSIIANGWYLQVQLLLYSLFYITFRLTKSDKLSIIMISVECIFMCVIMYALDFSSTWHESVLAFPLGMIWYNLLSHKTVCKKKYIYFTWSVFEFVLFVATLIGYRKMNGPINSLLFKMASAVLFTVFVATVINIINLNNTLTRWLGKYSLEIYIIQGVFLNLFHSRIIYIKNPYIYVIVVTALVIATSIILYPVTRKFYSLARKSG